MHPRSGPFSCSLNARLWLAGINISASGGKIITLIKWLTWYKAGRTKRGGGKEQKRRRSEEEKENTKSTVYHSADKMRMWKDSEWERASAVCAENVDGFTVLIG